MSEMIDVMKYLAGLSEAAPVQYGDLDVDTGMTDGDEDEYATKPGYEQDSMINQLGKVIDSEEAGKDAEDMKIKNFKPVTSVKTDDGKEVKVSPAQAKALKKMMDMLPSNRGGEEQSPREKFLDAIQNSEGLENMLDFAKSKGLVKETSELPQVDLSDIKSDYGIEEKEIMEGRGLLRDSCKNEQECKAWADDILKASINSLKIERGYDDSEPNPEYYSDVDYRAGEEHVLHVSTSGRNDWESGGQLDALAVQIDPVEDFSPHGDIDQVMAVIKADGQIDYDYDSLEKQFPDAEIGDLSEFDAYFKEAIEENWAKDIIQDAMEMSPEEFKKTYGDSYDQDELRKQYDDSHPEYEEPREPTEESAPFGEPSQQDQMYQDMMDAYEKGGEEELAKEMKMSMEELDDELNDISLETGLHMDDDRDEIIQRYVEDVVSNADFKDHGEMDYDREMEEMRKLAGLEEYARSRDEMSDEEKEDSDRREADPDSLTGSPMKVFKNLVKQEIGNKKFGFRRRK